MRSSTLSIASLSLIAQSLAAYVPSEAWSTLTPSATIAGATTDYTQTFGISIDPIVTSTGSEGIKKRDVITQIGDGQIQATTSTATTADAVVTQIGDGQIQATTSTATTAAAVVTQIGDGQIQATTSTATTADAVVTQIGDGQIQATTSTETTADVATQIGDGQVQASTTLSTVTSSTSSDAPAPTDDSGYPVSCLTNSSLAMTLSGSILTDANGRVGSIVANRQFQFDGPPPQAGALYAAGWSIDDGNLAIGNTSVFYQCLSGNFYNLYDENIGSECYPVYLKVIDLIKC
ncbi:hypothetical protein C6P40_000030 [Pichia californica]|uniref:Cell wall mannoprotein PIR1-like C-terminal domain-containing protein n=1 Tax=Pichia californica TaxID=460514 RepID=A0A9P7BIM1_9ASCO|nr:hypothetical protein C6P40_000030 [[Candida] californica]